MLKRIRRHVEEMLKCFRSALEASSFAASECEVFVDFSGDDLGGHCSLGLCSIRCSHLVQA